MIFFSSMMASWSYLLMTLWTHRVWNHHICPKKLSCTYIFSDYPIKNFCLLKTGNVLPFSSQILLCLLGKEAHRNNTVKVNMFHRGTFKGGMSLGWFVCTMSSIFKTKRNGKRKKKDLLSCSKPLDLWIHEVLKKKKSYCLIYWGLAANRIFANQNGVPSKLFFRRI